MDRTVFRGQRYVFARNHRFFFQCRSYRHRSFSNGACNQILIRKDTAGYSNSTALARCCHIATFVLLYIRLCSYIPRNLNGASICRCNHITCSGRYRSVHMQQGIFRGNGNRVSCPNRTRHIT